MCIRKAATNVDFFVAGIQLNGMGNRFQKCMTMTAVDDDLPEDTEYFRIRVSSSDSLVDIDRRNPVRVYITDNGVCKFDLFLYKNCFTTLQSVKNTNNLLTFFSIRSSHLLS